MTANHINPTDDQIVEDALEITSRRISEAADEARTLIKHIEQSRDEQPERLAKARAAADEARGWSVIEEPYTDQVQSVTSIDGTATLSLPSITAKELFGARLAFDILDCGDDFDRIDEVQNRYFAMTGGDSGQLFLLAMSALSTIAGVVVPQMLDDLEHSASNYDARVLLAEARRKSWQSRISQIRELNDEADKTGILPIDGYDIGSSAFDPGEV